EREGVIAGLFGRETDRQALLVPRPFEPAAVTEEADLLDLPSGIRRGKRANGERAVRRPAERDGIERAFLRRETDVLRHVRARPAFVEVGVCAAFRARRC